MFFTTVLFCRYRKLRELCDYLEKSNDILKTAVDKSRYVIKEQDDMIQGCHTEKLVRTEDFSNEEGSCGLFMIRRSENAPSLDINSIDTLFVVARNGEHALSIAKTNENFVSDEWWEVINIPIDEDNCKIVMTKYTVGL
jgi:hypothetical protein